MTEAVTEIRREGNLAEFAGKKYLGMETYKRSGQPVFTPVWFVTDKGLLYVNTYGGSGKVRRIQNNSRVRVAPITPRGKLDGVWVEGEARIVEDPSIGEVKAMMDAKYGLMDKFVARLYKWVTRRRAADTVVSIRV